MKQLSDISHCKCLLTSKAPKFLFTKMNGVLKNMKKIKLLNSTFTEYTYTSMWTLTDFL